ncbi:MAG: membrane protein insertion efficiency factor YidD [Lentisphaeria bacterium]|nr:membrane protein insertion efficiency factor YidD [Lentisphaeria bacterium]
MAARAAIALIRVYQKTISPWLPCCCRFEPSCSHYGVDAFRKRGFLAGSVLTIWRVMRCQPFCRGGYDPVPDKGFRRVTNDNQPDCKEK